MPDPVVPIPVVDPATVKLVLDAAAAGGYTLKPKDESTWTPKEVLKVGLLLLAAASSAFSANDLKDRRHGATPDEVDHIAEKRAKESSDLTTEKITNKLPKE